jgi:flagellar M-ring protein FliF
VNQLFGRLVQIWNALPMGRRVLLIGLVGVLAGVGVVMTAWSGQVTYAPLYSGLDPQDSGAIVNDLRTRAIPYQLGSGGSAILVPQAQVDQLRLDFAAQGLPQGGNVGFELLNGNSFTATDFVQRLNFQRGLQGELQRTIESLNAVQRARVHIVLPEKSLFVKDQTPPTASVVLQLRPGLRPDSREVRGIAHMVSGAVEGLHEENVSILDTTGAVLFDGSQLAVLGGSGASGTQLEMQQAYERNIESGVQQLLDRTLGAGRATVKASALLNFDRTETTTELFTPGPGATATPVARSASSVTETYKTNGGSTAGSIPGAVANVPGANTALPSAVAAAAAGGNGTDYTRNENTTNFEVGKTSTKSVQAVGGVKRLSLSLLIDDKVAQEQVASLEAAVKAASGLDDARGDTIAVGRFAFDHTLVEEATAAFKQEASHDQIMGYARIALPVVAVIVALVLFRLLMRSVASHSDGYRFAGGQAALADGRAGAIALGAGESAIRALPAPSAEMRSEMEQHVTKLISTQPQMVSDVMQAWIREDA